MRVSSMISLLEKAVSSRRDLFDDSHETAFRLFNGFSEGWPDLVLDIYASTLVITDYSDQPNDQSLGEISSYLQTDLNWLRATIIKKKHGRTQDEKRGQLIFGEKPDMQIIEHGIRYAINLMMNHDASFYLDTGYLRKWLIENTSGKSVLNTFAYSGSLGVAALAGGASKVIQNDHNQRFFELAKRSYKLNSIPVNRQDFIAADFFPTVNRFKTSKQLFDCIIIDPPFFSTTSKGKIDLVTESTRLINKVRPLISDGGILIAVNNALYLSGKQYIENLEELCRDGYLKIREIIPVPQSFIGYNNIRHPITDPSPFNHSTKIILLDVKRKGIK